MYITFNENIWFKKFDKYIIETKGKEYEKELYGRKDDLFSKELDIFEENNKDWYEKYNELNHKLSILNQSWEQYEYKEKRKRKEKINDYDFEDGLPELRRGNMCYYFTPVKGDLSNKESGNIICYNPRTKKDINLKIGKQIENESAYECFDEKGNTLFIIDYQSVWEAWDALFDVNR